MYGKKIVDKLRAERIWKENAILKYWSIEDEMTIIEIGFRSVKDRDHAARARSFFWDSTQRSSRPMVIFNQQEKKEHKAKMGEAATKPKPNERFNQKKRQRNTDNDEVMIVSETNLNDAGKSNEVIEPKKTQQNTIKELPAVAPPEHKENQAPQQERATKRQSNAIEEQPPMDLDDREDKSQNQTTLSKFLSFGNT
jgi:hypothetical protein